MDLQKTIEDIKYLQEKLLSSFGVPKAIKDDICGVKVNDDGTTTCFHSDRYMDEHPERTSQECTFDEIFNENTVKYMLYLIHKTNGN